MADANESLPLSQQTRDGAQGLGEGANPRKIEKKTSIELLQDALSAQPPPPEPRWSCNEHKALFEFCFLRDLSRNDTAALLDLLWQKPDLQKKIVQHRIKTPDSLYKPLRLKKVSGGE
jgi:hypothetical protein